MSVVKKILVALAVVLAVLLAPVVISRYHPWTRLCCREDYINIMTGEINVKKYYWYLKYHDQTKQSFLSRLVDSPVKAVELDDPWKTVNVFSPGLRNSPHFIYHSAMSQVRMFELLSRMVKLTENEKKEIAAEMLRRWQIDGNYRSVDSYLEDLSDKYESRMKRR